MTSENDPTGFRAERIKKLLDELRYELTRGMMEGEIDETLHWQYFVPVSRSMPEGVVQCRFETRPMPASHMPWNNGVYEPRLRVVK